MKSPLIIVFLLVVSCAVAAYSEDRPIKVGVIYGISGAAAPWGDFGRKGLDLALDEINSRGGVGGRKIQLIFEDSQSLAAKAVTGFQKLVTVDRVDAVIGDVWSYLTNPLIPLSQNHKIVLMSPTVMDNAVTTDSDYFFSMGHTTESLREASEEYFRKSIPKSAAMIVWDDAWGRAYSKLWQSIAEKYGVPVTDVIFSNQAVTDFRAEALRISNKKPELVMVSYRSEIFLDRLSELKEFPRLFSTNDVMESIIVRNRPAKSLAGFCFTDWQPNQDFRQKFLTKFGTDPAIEAHNHYEALRTLARAFELKHLPLNKAVRTVSYDGVAGSVDFRHSIFGNRAKAILRCIDGQGSVQ